MHLINLCFHSSITREKTFFSIEFKISVHFWIASSLLAKHNPSKQWFKYPNNQKSQGDRSGEYGGCLMTWSPCRSRKVFVVLEVCTRALSKWNFTDDIPLERLSFSSFCFIGRMHCWQKNSDVTVFPSGRYVMFSIPLRLKNAINMSFLLVMALFGTFSGASSPWTHWETCGLS